MKILITPCGIGTGHASRNIPLAKKLIKQHHQIQFASYGSGLEHLKLNGYKPYKLPKLEFKGENGSINIKKTATQANEVSYKFIKSMYKESRIIKKYKPDLIITDSHYSIIFTAKIYEIPTITITNDLTFGFSNNTTKKSIKYLETGIQKLIHELTQNSQQILIPDIPGTTTIPKELKEKTRYIGPILQEKPDKIPTKEILRKQEGYMPQEKIILVTVGGSHFGKTLIENICQISSKIQADKIIIFTGIEIKPKSIKTPINNKKVIIKQFTHHMHKWMKLSDMVIALAGHTTTMEIISTQKPNILIPIENHTEQEKNIKNMKKYKLTTTTNIHNKKELLKLINQKLENIKNIKINLEEYKNFKKTDGIENTLKIIENIKKGEKI
ncbi:MAG: UDP-N-acetylglucosamine--N-acetylmuramyl-(pentapeptide) pyrophosphoryl-undecaprenol N-acetylglucosamine transferase [Methanobacteriaceae archaeon]|nr:UDP-N-acetylglucosamine--N-acetylmuramyl-(pentapeptide) pyrophosphoryl-undecaprenol N-acetylglucosamine transferase [Methanobacteriaceae archaeon]